MTDQSLMDKSLRSVFVGNIPYEATEEKLKDIFSEVGPVLSFKWIKRQKLTMYSIEYTKQLEHPDKPLPTAAEALIHFQQIRLVYDRETGKPKGYGFCEYKDQETALSAMRNLNGYEIGGRTLRVDNACTEKSRMEMQSLLQGPVVENPYGEAVQADKAPEAISKAVASLPPEQMFELMKQMKLCVQNNPSEARQMLLQNPQLAYALLQAQVVMRIVDPQTAVSMLHKANPIPQVLVPAEKPVAPAVPAVPVQAPVAQPQPAPVAAPPTAIVREEAWPVQPGIPIGPRPPAIPAIPAPVQNQATPFVASDVDHRPLDPRLARMGDQDLRVPPAGAVVMQPIQPQTQPAVRDPRENFPVEQPQLVETAESFPRDPRQAVPERFPRDPRERVDPRTGAAPLPVAPPRAPAPVPPVMAPRPTPAPNMSPSIGGGASDQEKAALIMQVLQLSDEQIAMLPPEQRQSILVLKEQIAKSTQR